MKTIFKNIIPPLALLLTKAVKKSEQSTVVISTANGSSKVKNTEMAVFQHYKPIVKLSL